MPSVAVLVADGFETIECLTIVDVLRRGRTRCRKRPEDRRQL